MYYKLLTIYNTRKYVPAPTRKNENKTTGAKRLGVHNVIIVGLLFDKPPAAVRQTPIKKINKA